MSELLLNPFETVLNLDLSFKNLMEVIESHTKTVQHIHTHPMLADSQAS